MLVRLDSRASTDSPLLGTDSDKVKGQSDTFLIAGSVFDSCAGKKKKTIIFISHNT